MKNLIKFSVLFLFGLGLAGCLNDDHNKTIYYFYDEPAVIESLGDNSVIRTPHGKFLVPSLGDKSLATGTLLWSAFTVYPDEAVPGHVYKKANDFKYKTVDSAKVILPADNAEFNSYLSDNYTAFIYDAVLYRNYIDSLLFFGFYRSEPSDKFAFKYEIIRNPKIESANGYPTFYIRSKKIDLAEKHFMGGETVFAFDMTEFINDYKTNNPKKGPVKFNLKYKVGLDEEGKDVYREFRSNPIAWNVTQ
jgi:hypothetical protein